MGHPLVLFVASNAVFSVTAAHTSRGSPIRYFALAYLMGCAFFFATSLQRFTKTTGWVGRVPAGAMLSVCINFTDKLLIRRWDYEHYGSAITKPATSGKQQEEADHSEEVPKNDLRKSRSEFAGEVTGNARGIGTFWQVKNVPPFSAVQPAFVPTRGSFVFKQSIAVVVCYYLHNLAVHAFLSLDLRLIAPTHAPSLAGALNLTPAHLKARTLSTVFFWTSQYAMLQFFYSLSGLVSVVAIPETIKLWPPFFGSPADAYTLRNFWGKSWHQALRANLASVSDHVAHEILRLPHKGPLQRYTKIFISFALSGVMHIVADMGCGLSPRESGAMTFFLMQALGIMVEDGVQAVWRRSSLQPSLGRRGAQFARVVGYAWVAFYLVSTSPGWVYPAYSPMRREDALLSFGAVKPLFFGRR